MELKAVVTGIAEVAKVLGSSDSIQRSLFGSYSDGSTRSLPDAWGGEFMSPKEKKTILYGDDDDHKKKKKKKKKKGKKKYKYNKKKNRKKKKDKGPRKIDRAGTVKFTI